MVKPYKGFTAEEIKELQRGLGDGPQGLPYFTPDDWYLMDEMFPHIERDKDKITAFLEWKGIHSDDELEEYFDEENGILF